MPLTVGINGLSLVHEASNGVAMATAPDVCLTPSPTGPVPVPYPNVALSSTLAKGTKRVLVDGGSSAAIDGSEFSQSTGDEAGTAGGVASGANMAAATWLSFSTDVMLEGKPACRLTDKMLMNKGNTVCAAGEQQAAVVSVPIQGGSAEREQKLRIDLLKEFCEKAKVADKKSFAENHPGWDEHKCFLSGQRRESLYDWLAPDNYGRWCGKNNAPADITVDQLFGENSPEHEIYKGLRLDMCVEDSDVVDLESAKVWLKKKRLPEPSDAVDGACLLHDLRIANLNRNRWIAGKEPLDPVFSQDDKIYQINARFRDDLASLVFNPSEDIDPCGRIFAAFGTKAFSVITPFTHPVIGTALRLLGMYSALVAIAILLPSRQDTPSFVHPAVQASRGAMGVWETLANERSLKFLVTRNTAMINWSW